jgi:hypothetical protein
MENASRNGFFPQAGNGPTIAIRWGKEFGQNGDRQGTHTPTPILGLFTSKEFILNRTGADQPECPRTRFARLQGTNGDPARMQKILFKQNSNEQLLTQP